MKYIFPLHDLWGELTAIVAALVPLSYEGAKCDGYPVDVFGNTPNDLALHWIENVLKRMYGVQYVRDTAIVVTLDEELILSNLEDFPFYDFAVQLKCFVRPVWDVECPVCISLFGTDLQVEVM